MYGIRGNIPDWFASYLAHRSKYVVYSGCKSETMGITCGSMFGPLLFIVYINDIYNVSDLLFKILYADDTIKKLL